MTDKAAAYEVARAECFAWADAAAAVDSIPRYPGSPTDFKTAYNAKIAKVCDSLCLLSDRAEKRAEKARKAAAMEPMICASCGTDYDRSKRKTCPGCYCAATVELVVCVNCEREYNARAYEFCSHCGYYDK